ncbi:hypothetical protein N7462_003453 [Penicillium macrosclerotiorum]|uniref:uncharacterized protein n=1 Tax=Penicillium macrosclerotiorum TaxID=303699 RepID=UPI002548E23C|nr:uncharacterized protein N7462_003453 [Penicillium macrosclerotiorum]KAJ5689061.1 hypothetical protein N7462_003453 [Penicillium macrosclerotiorum]
MRNSLSQMVADWFCLRVLNPDELQYQKADFLVVTEHEYRTFSQLPTDSDIRKFIKSKTSFPLIVLGAQVSSRKLVKENDRDRAIFLSQPVSPKTLATAFEYCLGQYGAQSDINSGDLSPTTESDNSSPQLANKEETSTEEQLEPRGDAKNILLVEDNNVNLKIIEACVKNTSFTYRTASNGLEAVELFKNERFDAVVMDISMPVMDGLSATREIRHHEKTNNLHRTSIIILTAALSADVQREANRSGVDKFLTKPTPLKQLREILQSLP